MAVCTALAISCTIILNVFAINDDTYDITSSSVSTVTSSESDYSQPSSKNESVYESKPSSEVYSSSTSSYSNEKYEENNNYDYASSSKSTGYDYYSSSYDYDDDEIYNYTEDYSSSKASSKNYSTSSSYSKSSVGTASLLEGNSSKDKGDDYNSQDWNKILESISKNANIGNNFTFSDTNEDNSTSSKNDDWLFWVGVALIALSIFGIWWVIYTEYFSRKSPRMMNIKSNAVSKNNLRTLHKIFYYLFFYFWFFNIYLHCIYLKIRLFPLLHRFLLNLVNFMLFCSILSYLNILSI